MQLWNRIPSDKRNFQNVSEVRKYLREIFFSFKSYDADMKYRIEIYAFICSIVIWV